MRMSCKAESCQMEISYRNHSGTRSRFWSFQIEMVRRQPSKTSANRVQSFRIRSWTGHVDDRNVTEVAAVLLNPRYLRQSRWLSSELGLWSLAQSVPCSSVHERTGRCVSNIHGPVLFGRPMLDEWRSLLFNDISSRQWLGTSTVRWFYRSNCQRSILITSKTRRLTWTKVRSDPSDPVRRTWSFVLDVKLLERWYLLDDKLSPPVYRLRDPDEDFANILSRSTSTYDLSQRENQEWNDAYTSLIDLFISVLHDKSSKSKHETSSLHDIQLFSGVEMLFNYASKLSPSGCMCILRQFDGNVCLRY